MLPLSQPIHTSHFAAGFFSALVAAADEKVRNWLEQVGRTVFGEAEAALRDSAEKLDLKAIVELASQTPVDLELLTTKAKSPEAKMLFEAHMCINGGIDSYHEVRRVSED